MGKDIIFEYTLRQAEEDGVLVNVTKINPSWKKGPFNYVTSNLLSKGYMKGKEFNVPCLVDLLNQSLRILKIKTRNFRKFDTFFEGRVEFPSGNTGQVFICQNETGKFTIMLPEDY